MPRMKRKLVIRIPLTEVKKEFGWLYENWKESAVVTYLVKNPHSIDEGLSLVGVGELYYSPPPDRPTIKHTRADIVFRKHGLYYVVEVKPLMRFDDRIFVWPQVEDEVASFEYDMRQHNERCEEIIPVLAMVDDSIEKIQQFWEAWKTSKRKEAARKAWRTRKRRMAAKRSGQTRRSPARTRTTPA